ncbi:hypothetical protein [Paenibacillus mendelii]|uniref:DUF3899 domain-containing protein n=1 Tax=Paenibacillus mendelii TaxID=206163 RepID=A0ABV6JCY1_9BACL|nr:hypothetical protein [Paenibacillus mendelii]MCQ6562496.1 hypothetical protein [Paenibacillus mendelii]
MAIWRGLGIIAIFIAAAMVAIIGYFAQYTGLNTDEQHWPEAVALVLAGIIVWFLGKALNAEHVYKPNPDSAAIDAVQAREQHSLLFIRMEYWGPIFALVGVITFFAR